MTSVAPLVLSAISGGAYRPWHYARTETERHRIIRSLLGQDRGHVLFYVWDRPAGGEDNQYPSHQLKIVYHRGAGAGHYTDSDPGHGPVGAWLTHTDRPLTDPPEVVYDPWDPGRVVLPVSALLPVDRLVGIAVDHARTGRRPAVGRWTPVEWV